VQSLAEDSLEAGSALGAGCARLPAVIVQRKRATSWAPDSDQYDFPNDCTLEAMRAQGARKTFIGAQFFFFS